MTPDTWFNFGYGAVGPFIFGAAGYVAARWQSRHRPKLHPINALINRRDLRIHELLAELRIRMGDERTMRAYVSQLHNGDEFVTGGAMRRKSRTHEVVRPGVAYQTDSYQGVLVSAVPQEMEMVIAEGPSFQAVDHIKEGKFRSLCEQGGVRSVARAAIMSGKDVVAFVGLDFDTEEQPEHVDLICEYARLIAPLLPEPRGILRRTVSARRPIRFSGRTNWRESWRPPMATA